MKLLLAEDEKELSSVIAKLLRHSGFAVETVFDGEDALAYIKTEKYDAVILDIMMPKVDGISVVKEVRRQKNYVPILMLTAKAELDDKVLGLDAGADDYLTKPFAGKELIARIRALTRRKSDEICSYSFGNVTLNPQTFEISTNYGMIRLTCKEFQMLEMLFKNENILVSTESFLERIWGFDTDAEINVVWVFISALRKKLASIKAEVAIKAVRGVGYKLEQTDD